MLKNRYTSFSSISILVIWTFHLSGLLGILYGDSKWFISATPLNLIISLVLLLLNSSDSNKTIMIAGIAFIIGMFTEILGVNYGLIFGTYFYGEALGPKLLGVPILIGYNWAMVLIITASIAQKINKNFYTRIFLGVTLMLFLDLLIEPVAPDLDFWIFDSGIAPIQNYLGWVFVSFLLHFIYQKLKIKKNNNFSNHLYFLQILFFVLLLIKFRS
ncbi:MAG: putative membrane protein [Candidatus Marivariicella framensis]|jgi:putative membrane protein|tara:strand:- start:3806 stop:4450 length:645 start_codon:yes stop_codon:yes gene_type:complete